LDTWPSDFPLSPICFSMDVEWAAPSVVADVVALLDKYGIKATFFVTHDGVNVPGHERGLHPNFRRNGDAYRALPDPSRLDDNAVYEHVVSLTNSYAPEAKGVRAHSLHYDSTLLPVYRRHGLEFECSQRLPLVPNLRPFWNQHGIIGIPSYFSDYFDLVTGTSRFELARLRLDEPGLKVLDFHPNIVFANFSDEHSYQESKSFYHDSERLLSLRGTHPGARSLLIDALRYAAKHRDRVFTLGELNAIWRTRVAAPWDGR
jgi:peptidoglycan/xylan/chitin deacetylase (PgdA/CDA1 family)